MLLLLDTQELLKKNKIKVPFKEKEIVLWTYRYRMKKLFHLQVF